MSILSARGSCEALCRKPLCYFLHLVSLICVSDPLRQMNEWRKMGSGLAATYDRNWVAAAALGSVGDPVQKLAHEQSLAGRERRRFVQMCTQADRERC